MNLLIVGFIILNSNQKKQYNGYKRLKEEWNKKRR